ncbi:cell envelope integrity protein CreD [Mucilaginibacter sp. dw_454]|uniref:cell envelope integrity protein CreD n=1 Tax=Mucilaginibacter sp. dw_454 TaxID=2720079 RepID=UPI001BD4A1EB|nr:cell envelope integrity protein CreD [Mucilaginibacter sp. dw_454]
MEQQNNTTQLTKWFRESVTVKLVFIGMLSLVLLIPSVMISNLINERAQRRDEVISNISYNFAGKQLIKGPVLVIPYRDQIEVPDGTGKSRPQQVERKLFLLPEQLSIKAGLKTDVIHKGMFSAVVYKTQVRLSGNFAKADLSALGIRSDQLIPEKAFITFSVSDLKGLKTNPSLTLGNQTFAAAPSAGNESAFTNGLQAAATNAGDIANNALPFSCTLDLNGTDGLSFLQLGKTTDVELSGNWGTPNFDGRYLPDTRQVNNKDFSARWHVLYYNSPFPQQWTDSASVLNNANKQQNATFGVNLRLPVDDYQETTRTNKYAILIILLAFVSLFLTELICKQRIHSFNYVLVGAAMIIFYTLLLSFSEQIGFNWAYLVASVATIGLITAFIASLIKNRVSAFSFAGILSVFYGFIYIIIQLEDFALMAGSIALFIIVAALMYFSRKINWDNANYEEEVV